MLRKRYTAEQIIGHLREAEIRTSEGKTIAEAVRELGISEQTYYRWRKQYGGMEVNQARRLSANETPAPIDRGTYDSLTTVFVHPSSHTLYRVLVLVLLTVIVASVL